MQAVKAFTEAAAYPGPSLIIAYSQCIAHGLDMASGMAHQHAAVASGYWPLWRLDSREDRPLHLDCRKPDFEVGDFLESEDRFAALGRIHPETAGRFAAQARADAAEQWARLEVLAAQGRS